MIHGEQMLFDAVSRKLEAHTEDDRPALQSAAGTWPTPLTQQTPPAASSEAGVHHFSSPPNLYSPPGPCLAVFLRFPNP